MIDMGFLRHLVKLTESLYDSQEAAIRVEGEMSEWFSVGKGVRQGCILSPYLFNIYAENIMRNFRNDPEIYDCSEKPGYDTYDSLNIGGREYPELRYADDTVLLSTTPEGLEKMINSVKTHSEKQNLCLNAKKTKIMRTDKTSRPTNIVIDNSLIEEVPDFDYLGSLLTNNGDGFKEIKRRLGMATKKLKTMTKLWKGADEATKLKFLKSLIFPIAKYGAETWSISKQAEQRINAFEMKSYRKILRVPWTDKRTNASIREQLKVKEETWLLNSIIKHNMTYSGHVKRHDCLEKNNL